jgi:hypothetical protein
MRKYAVESGRPLIDDRRNGVVVPDYTEAVFVAFEIVTSNSRSLQTSGRDR